jgi:hypothetical protein
MARSSTSGVPGNGLAVRHGAGSSAIVALNTPPVVAEIVGMLTAEVPYLAAADQLLVEGLARKVVQRRLVWQHIDRLGGSLIDSRGRPRGCWKMLAALDHSLREDAKLLGLGPAVRAQLMQSMAGAQSQGLAGQLAARQLERQREAAISPPKEVS